ncbi:MAG TPA: hypothetical protein VM030_04645 [Acidimicrobiales bacterium]|nr:hypothetical protein [Acidimicrobiales bacterium]
MDDLSADVRERLMARVAGTTKARSEAMERARELLASGDWEQRSADVAAELVDCLVGNRVP